MVKLRRDLVVVNILLINIVLGAGLTTSLLSVYFDKMGISLTNVGIIFAFGAIIAGFLRLPIGCAVDCFGKKGFVILGAIGYPLFAVGIALARTVPQFIGLDIMLEMFGAIFWTAFSAHYFDLLSRGNEGIEIAQKNVIHYSAAAAAPFLAGMIADRLGFANLFYIGALIAAIGIPIAVLSIKDHAKCKTCFSFKDLEQEYKDVFKIKGFKTILGVLLINNITWSFWAIYMPIYLANKGFNFSEIGLVITAIWVSTALIQIPIGKAIDKFPAKWILIPGFGLVFLGSILFFQFRNFAMYLVGRCISSIGWDMSYWPAVGIFAKNTPKREHGAGWAALTAAIAVSYGAAALVGGFLTDRFGIELVLYVSAFASFLFGIALITNKVLADKGTKHHKRHQIMMHHVNSKH